MEGSEAGTYLTSRLLKLDPQYFEEEVARRARQARRRGFLVGVASALLLALAGIGVWIFASESGLVSAARLVLGI